MPKKKSSKNKRERKTVEQKDRKRVAREKEAQIFRSKREVQVSRKGKIGREGTGKDTEALTNK